MGMNTQVIGTGMPNGQAGSYARQPDMIINTKAPVGSTSIPVGAPVEYDANGVVVVQMGAASTATKFVGVAAREVKSSLNYLDQGQGEYAPKEAVPVFQRGSINVICQRGTPKVGGKVYVRTTANESFSTSLVGGFEAEDDSGKVAELTNCQWAGPKDGNNIAELRILTMINA